jgi:hypothetical protein
MSILSSLLHKILGDRPANAATPAAGQAPAAANAPVASTPAVTPGATVAPAAAAPSAPPAMPAAVAAGVPVDVEAVLGEKAKAAGQPLNWKTSIVDLMKLVGMDSSLTARKELAEELHYTGDMSDSAQMNVWLHGQVMQKLAANGGKLPADLAS